MVRKPDFIVAGAPKCGTTSMHEYLDAHPDVFVPVHKEPNYFSTDVRIRQRLDRGRYLALFAPAEPGLRAGEVSVWYLYSRIAARAIHEECGPIRIVAMLRNPVDAMHSLHSQFVYTGDEDIEGFAEALAAEEARRRGERIPAAGWKGPECLCYRRVFDFPEQLERFQRRFGAEAVHVVLLDDLHADAGAATAELSRFLGIRHLPDLPFGRVNPNKRVRSVFLRDLHRKYDRRARALARRLIPSTSLRQKLGKRLAGGVKRTYTIYEQRAPMDPDLRRRLTLEMAPSVERLAKLIDRDLSAWLPR